MTKSQVHKSPEMFERLLSVVWRPHNFYCVHVDSKTPPDVFARMAHAAACLGNVVLTGTRLSVVHGHISSLAADLECAKEALASAVRWRYHLNVCGQEFPLRTNLEMVQILTALRGNNDVENYPPSPLFAGWSFKFRAALRQGVNLPTNVTKTPFLIAGAGALEVRKGSAYNCVRRDFLEWALRDEVRHLNFLV